ncbi:molecular chaperone [Bacillus sp. FJAT-27445]|uniref:TorD/DmsD family molecular chaperone n=1 Tax=Bacillus sp. FJAT-27445 TaxID=1679166 RepID=UPI000743E926|nr:molecular chaperone TorD family protein [Bacillus sp. FJAT-27445]
MATNLETNGLIPLLEARHNLYLILHGLFFAPLDKEWVESFLVNGDVDGLQDLGVGGTELYEFFKENHDLEREAKEYSRLFIGPGTLPAPPWESFYTSREQMLFDESAFAVRQQYHSVGLKFAKENNEPDDHLVLELEFMIRLIEKGIGARDSTVLNRCLKKELYFLKQHLGKWIGKFGKALANSTSSKLYKGAALLAADFIAQDIECLNEVLEGMSHAG